MEDIKWDKTVDAVVIGSGASGMTAALTAHFEGLEVLLIEKTRRIGGSTAVSGGAVWLPLNSQSAAAGHPDSFEKVWEYLDHTVGDASAASMKRAYLEMGPKMLDYMTSHEVLTLAARTFSPDYYPDRPGAALGGRALDPVEFDGRKLGRHFKELHDPLKEFVVLGGMMVSLVDVRHLLNMSRSLASFWHGGKLVLRYGMDRVRGYHRGTRLLLGNALAAQLFAGVLRCKLPYWLSTAARRLHCDASGRVLGITVDRDGVDVNIQVRKGVVVASGGFPWNASLRQALYPKPTGMWSMSPADNQGDGIRLAQEAGAVMGTGHVSPAFWAPVSIWTKPDGGVIRYPHLVWDRSKPGLIAVNANGRRFVNESSSYHEFVLGMYRSNETVSSIPAHLICDQAFVDKWGLGLALPGGRPRQHLIDAGYLLKAGSLGDLARQMGVPADELVQTVNRYNDLAAGGVDTDFGKGSTEYNRYLGDPQHKPNPCLAPLGNAPFYAVKVVAGDIGTACGISCDEHARALGADGQAIAGLYVAGNDMQSVMGGAYPAPGITLGPALTFGWVAGRQLALQ
ncbi:MAG: FAD-binding protein [Candidimonas sp.]|nr:MAG: FAD-binding protein [Candidimonas sp.]TAM25265.1 MAG: FAD-binding protein [Candidimonas sp.]TAM76746.1 MAG: FAD-binding protein [Candidimonas sp.]